jgi:cobaltochelatase CobN
MHLLLAQKGEINDGDEAVDLGQSSGDILFLTAADTEVASVAAAVDDVAGLKWRLANLSQLKHPMSVDTYVERMAKTAKLIVIRALGGASYFSYAIEALFAAADNNNVKIIVLPGDDKPDPELDRFNNLDAATCEHLWNYLIQGGQQNSDNFVRGCEAAISDAGLPASAKPLLKAGLYWPKISPQSLSDIQALWEKGAPVVAISFYRALVQSGQTAPIDALIAELLDQGINPLPIFVASLKDPVSQATVTTLFDQTNPGVVINATGFAVSKPGMVHERTVLEREGAVVLQAVLAGNDFNAWQSSSQGLTSRDLAMNVALPEIDGRVMTRAISFKSAGFFDERVETNIIRHEPHADGIAFVAELAKNWSRLKAAENAEKRVALILANYPNQDGRLANGVGLDTPASTVEVLSALAEQGYSVENAPKTSDELMDIVQRGPTNAKRDGDDQKQIQEVREILELGDYQSHFNDLPQSVQEQIQTRWGDAKDDPFVNEGRFELPLTKFGNVVVGVQPARGYNIDPTESYHSPDLVPPHGYFAFYFYLREKLGAHAVVHMGKHGNLEWLPGKALALSKECFPAAILGALPHIYPFIVNDPGEGTQAKRRTSAVIIDHLTPPLTRAESYGPLKDLEALVDEYYLASGHDPRRLKLLKKQILELVRDTGIGHDAGVSQIDNDDLALEKLDAWLCELKEMQIRDGLHIFGVAPEGRLLEDLTVALARLPRGTEQSEQSLHRAITKDLDLGEDFDPLDCEMAKQWTGDRPDVLQVLSEDNWRTNGDTVERIELLASDIVAGNFKVPYDWVETISVLAEIDTQIKPSVTSSGEAELDAIIKGLDGEFIAPGPSGAPTRGRPDVLPTGRNFYSVDSRALPTPAAWELGKKSAELLIARYVQDHGNWPTSFGVTAWGTSNMRTGGDDLAQVLALIGVKPTWDMASRRMTGYEIIPQAKLGRPRVDVTLRISGFFRDAFPDQISLIDRAIRAVGALEEDQFDNPIAARMRDEFDQLVNQGVDEITAKKRAGYRVFGSKPGAYGAGLQALIDEKGWDDQEDLAKAYTVWGGYAYGANEEGKDEQVLFEKRLGLVQAVVQNQDNREHDLLDSDDYYQFEGGMTAAVAQASGQKPAIYHNDHSRPEKPVIRSLDEEISRVVRARVVNPKWINGVMRHGYKGAFEMAATVDYMFAFSATTGSVRDHHFELVYQAYLGDDEVRDFIEDANPEALKEMAARFIEAVDRGLWTPRSNSAKFDLAKMVEGTH